MDPVPDTGLLDSHHAVLDAHSHARLLSRLDDHDPSNPPVSYSSPNHDVASSSANSNTQVLAHHAAATLEPDDFYKSFGALSHSGDPESLPMASSVPQSSLRPNGDGAAARHLQSSANHHSPRRQNLRSVSSPLDARSAATSSRHPQPPAPSVQDLKKRFDQKNSVNPIPSQTSRPGATPSRTRKDLASSKPPSTSPVSPSHRSGIPAPASLRDSSNSPSANRSQLPKNVAQGQVSSSSRSFASRIGNPQNSANGNSIASKSMTNLPHKSPPQPNQPQPSSPKLNSRSPGLLFGEISQDQRDTSAAGFGIDAVPPRRTSESSVHGLVGRQRSFSDLDAEPASPSTWYRDRRTTDEAAPPAHARSRSDLAPSKPAALSSHKRLAGSRSPSSAASNAPPATSKLPVSIRRLNSPTNSSPSSTRSSSPTTFRRPQANGRSSKNPSPISRAKTPTQTSRKPPPSNLVTPVGNNTRLKAYVTAAPSMLSPPLRSSRPRQPVSAASTTSSRMKESAKAKSSTRSNAKDPNTAKTTGSPRRRKISVGPIDFEQRREHIRLAYSKSIRDSQVLEARQKAAEKRRRDMEAAAKAKAAAASGDTQVEKMAGDDEPQNKLSGDGRSTTTETHSAHVMTAEVVNLPSHGSEVGSGGELTSTLKLATGHTTEKIDTDTSKDDDSPTLGVPGSFPDLSPPAGTNERPHSAVSMTSAITEFDTEPQTEPPVPARTSASISATINRSSGSEIPIVTYPRAEYQSPFDDELHSPKLPLTDNAPAEVSSRPLGAKTHADEQLNPGNFYDGGDETPVFMAQAHGTYETIVKIIPQPDAEPRTSEADTVPFPRLDMQDDSDCHSELDSVHAIAQHIRHDLDDAATDACTEETDDRDGLEEAHSSYQYRDQFSSHRASTCASSDPETFDDLLYPPNGHEQQVDAGSSNRLLVPPTHPKPDRSSHHSAWTDFSFESAEHSETSNSPTMHATLFKSVVYSSREEPSFDGHDSGVYPSNDSARSSGQLSQQLPEVNIGEDFSIPYLSPDANSSFSYLPSPRHGPPPIPQSGSNSAINSRTSSVFYDQSQYGSTLLNSERESVEYMSRLETPQSMDITPNETPDLYFGSQTPADSDAKSFIQESEELSSEERHRLIQRRNVIKELVDTEAIFVRDMNIVEEIYKGTAEACPKLDAKIVKLIFRNSDEIIEFHTAFFAQIKEAVAGVYIPKGSRSHMLKDESFYSEPSQSSIVDLSDARDRETSIGPVFQINMEKLKLAHEGFLRNSDHAAKKLIEIQQDPTVKVWLNECNEVAKDLTAAWDLDSLLIKPMQRITKYPNLIMTLLQHTPQDHPDREPLVAAKDALEEAIVEINKTKKNFELVGQIVGRKRKESDVKAGLARAFGKRVDKLQGGNRPPDDPEYAKLEEKFTDDYLRLQVVLRDVEFYTRQVSSYVHEFLQYLSAIELVMRLQPGSYPELESKWVQFNISVRDLEKLALENHLSQVRKNVIEPFEHVIKAYGNPSLAMKKRQKRRVVYERAEQLKRAGKTVDPKLKELVEQYEALNDTLIKELPKLSALTERVGNICLGNFVNIQAEWYAIWQEKMRTVLPDTPEKPDLEEIVATFQRDFPYASDLMNNISIIHPEYLGRASQSTAHSIDESSLRTRGRQSEADSRGRGLSVNGESAPSLPTPDFAKRHSGSFAASPIGSANASTSTSASATGGVGTGTTPAAVPSPHQYYYRDYYANISNYQSSLASPRSGDMPGSSRSHAGTRPSTGRSFDSSALPRQSMESAPQGRRDSNTTYNSSQQPHEGRRYSNLFHSALPMTDGPEESQRSSRASSRERLAADGYNILWLAASLFEFNIATTKHEAGYPYLTYQAGEIFDVIAEKGELWLAKNQDDPTDQVGWIWSKHFAKLADS